MPVKAPEMIFKVVYPEEMLVSEKKIRGWAFDLIDDEEIEGPKTESTGVLIQQMEDYGCITVVGAVFSTVEGVSWERKK